LVAGKNRVPSPATGKIAFVIDFCIQNIPKEYKNILRGICELIKVEM